MYMEEKSKKKHGGFREGSGRKKTTEKRYGFNAPSDVVEILERVQGSKTDFICNAIRNYRK